MQERFDSYSTHSLFQVLKKRGIDLNKDCQETRFSIPPGAGTGEVNYFQFCDGLSNFIFNGKLETDWEWEFRCERTSPLYIFFLLSGRLEDVRPGHEPFQLEPMQTLMVVHPGGASKRSIVFKAGEPIKVSVIALRKNEYLARKGCKEEELPTSLQLFLSMKYKEVKALFPPDRITLDTSLIVQEILGCPHKGLMRNCFVEAKTRELLLRSLERNGSEFLQPEDVAFLKNADLEKLITARQILKNDLRNAPTIEELSKRVGLNRQKLKVGFKATFGKTIFQFLREERMTMAKSLLMNSRTTVQQVAAEVGYENASHFSRRFQEQFGILPGKFSAMYWRKGQEN